MKNIQSLLSWRYLWASRKESTLSTMVMICFFGIAIGTFALALILAIMNGFEKVTHEKLRGIHTDLIMRMAGTQLEEEKIGKVLANEFPEIEAWSPSSIKQLIIQTPNSDDVSNVVIIKGIAPAQEQKISSLAQKIVLPLQKNLTQIVQGKNIMIGKKLAATLGVTVGSPVSLLYMRSQKAKGRKVTLDTKDAIIGGIFDTGIEEFDSNLALASLEFLQQLYPDLGVAQINMKLKKGVDEEKIMSDLAHRFKLDVFSWKDLYPALVSALKLEKYAMFLMLALITLVASTNVISLLFMQIVQKRADIALLKSMGAPDTIIKNIFIRIGMMITVCATSAGLIAAFIAGLILEKYPFITLPDTYYVTHLPAKMEPGHFILVFCVVMAISFLSIWIPARRAGKINIAHVLRFEA